MKKLTYDLYKNLLFVIFTTVLFVVVESEVEASTNYYYADNQKIYLEEVADEKIYKLESNKKKTVKLKSKELKQVYPKSFYYRIDLLEDKDGSINKKFRKLLAEPSVELPIYREIDTKEELIITEDYLASFRKDLTNEEFQNIVEKELNSEIVESLHYVLDGVGYHMKLKDPLDNVLSVSNKCVENGWCIWAHPNFIRRVYRNSIPSDTYYPQQWHLRNINAEQAWDITKGNPNITIAVIDDGLDWDHEEFSSPGKITKRFNLIEGGNDTRLIGSGSLTDILNNLFKDISGMEASRFSHGTQVGGLAAAAENSIGVVGVCPNCMLMPIRIATDASIGSGLANFFSVADDIGAAAIVKAVDEGSDIINNSWGRRGFISDIKRNAINYAHQHGRNGKGTVVVFSAGNGVQPTPPCETTEVYAPANYQTVIAVGAVDRNDKITCYSSTGSELDIVAPGGSLEGDIATTDLVGLFGKSPSNIISALSLGLLGFNQIWTLTIYDNFLGLVGIFNSWSLDFTDINNNSYVFTSVTTPPTTLPDGLHPTIPLPSFTLTSPIAVSLPLGVALIKEINFSLNVNHPLGLDLEAVITPPTGGGANFIFNAFNLSNNFQKSGPFIPISMHQLYMATSLPNFELDNNGNYTSSFNGTSAAAPIVSGLVGLILSVNPNLTYQQVDQILKDTADKIDPASANYDSFGHSNIYGYGRINAEKTVQRARELGSTPIVVPTPILTPTPTPEPISQPTTPPIEDTSVEQGSITLSTLPKTKRHIFKLLAEGTNFISSSSCNVDASVGGLKMNVFPKTFNWSSGNHKIIIRIAIPKSLRKFLYKQAGNKIITIEISCSNGVNSSKEVPIQ